MLFSRGRNSFPTAIFSFVFTLPLQPRLRLQFQKATLSTSSTRHLIFVFTLPIYLRLPLATISSSSAASSRRLFTHEFHSPLQLCLYHHGQHRFQGQSFQLPLNQQALPSVEVWCEHVGEVSGEDGVVEQHSNRCIRAREGCDDFPRLNRHACAAELPDSTDCRLAFQPVFQELCIGWA